MHQKVVVQCKCGKMLAAPVHLAGGSGRCTGCGTVLAIPSKNDAAPRDEVEAVSRTLDGSQTDSVDESLAASEPGGVFGRLGHHSSSRAAVAVAPANHSVEAMAGWRKRLNTSGKKVYTLILILLAICGIANKLYDASRATHCAEVALLTEREGKPIDIRISSTSFDGAKQAFLDVQTTYHRAISDVLNNSKADGGLRLRGDIESIASFRIKETATEDSTSKAAKRLAFTVEAYDDYGKEIDRGEYTIVFEFNNSKWALIFVPAFNNIYAKHSRLDLLDSAILLAAEKQFPSLWSQEGALRYTGCGSPKTAR
jgi:hypothetical protein